jgi:hypothetical protein
MAVPQAMPIPASPSQADTNTVVDIRVIPFIAVLSYCSAPVDQSSDKWGIARAVTDPNIRTGPLV